MSKFDLTKEQELELLVKAQAGDRRALSTFVEKNQGLVQKIANGLSNYGLSHEDLVQEGNVGLMKAIQHFDPSKNARFSTMAVDYIRTPMYKYIRANARTVKCPSTRNSAKLFYTLPKMVSSADQLSDEKITEISKELDISVDEINFLIPFVFGSDFHITLSSDEEQQPGCINWEQLFDDSMEDLQSGIIDEEEKLLIKACIHECIDELPDQQKEVINERWFNGTGDIKTFSEVANDHNVRHQAMSQREQHAFKALRSNIRRKLAKRYNIFM